MNHESSNSMKAYEPVKSKSESVLVIYRYIVRPKFI